MYKDDFSKLEELIEYVKKDKHISGSDASTANRYPVRFVLFDNFRDSFEFVSIMQDQFGCMVKSVNDWMDSDYSDVIVTYSRLADKIIAFARQSSLQDCVVAPFSELARFYDNKDNFEFDALVSTIKGIESTNLAFADQQRIYIPIVGLEGKTLKFKHDSQIFIWYFKNGDRQLNYRLVLTDGTTYGVQGLEEKFTLVTNVREWLQVWRDKNAGVDIISTSSALYANAGFAQPDNAFTFCACSNVYDFLVNGLALDFGSIEYREKEEKYWLRLAQEINISNFSFEKFFNKYFHVDDLADHNVFLKIWFDCKDDFEKWLLTNYYAEKSCQKSYLRWVIKASASYTNYDFFAAVALTVFGLEEEEKYLEERAECLYQATQKQVCLTKKIQEILIDRLQHLASEKGFSTAIRYFSPLTEAEKLLALRWLGEGKITRDEVKLFFSDLYHYLGKSFEGKNNSQKWLSDYIAAYKQCKISNNFSKILEDGINEHNASEVTFNQWYQDFKTTKTVLSGRSDIEVYYWIDGLGIDWISYISELLDKEENIYLNEVCIARALYPTTTAVNKLSLVDLSGNKLQKIGDLDTHAHKQGNKYPDYIMEEIHIVKEAIKRILSEYAGKKIAIVSDHGLTALSQFKEGLNLAGVESDHGGRIAIRKKNEAVSDNCYVVLDDHQTMCALRHESLCSKIPNGQCAHGGCTPEEALVPVFIISSQRNDSKYVVELKTEKVLGTNPVVEYEIKGLSTNEDLYLVYNNERYELTPQADNLYCSSPLNLKEGIAEVVLYIGTDKFSSRIEMNLGAEEDDLFDF